MRALRVFDHDACLAHASEGHVERPERLEAARRALRDVPGVQVDWREAPRAGREEALAVHTEAHLARVERACGRGEWLDPDTYACSASLEAAYRSAGAALAAARSALHDEPAFALGRPPGHHATRERPMGFCLLNNVALAADALAREGARVAIVDLDVHHGNGTQDVFYERDDVHFSSLHGWPLYPGTGRAEETGAGPGRGHTVNVPLPAGTGHEAWMRAFHDRVLPEVRRFRPDAILVSAGTDAHWRDPLGNLRLVAQSWHEAVALLRDATPRIAAVLEGGYDLEGLRLGARAVAAALVGADAPEREDEPPAHKQWVD